MQLKYAINKSEAEVQMIDGKIRVPYRGWKELTAAEAEHPDVQDAVKKNWIDVKDIKPAKVPQTGVPRPPVVADGHKAEAFAGLTQAEFDKQKQK